MAAIAPKDWGRIYAYMWREAKNGKEDLLRRFEKNPTEVIDEIKPILKIQYDRLFDIPEASDFTDDQLVEIINETADPASFQFFLRLSS